ncbi:hypothetical protein HID58_035439, partial [Brassica napus]
ICIGKMHLQPQGSDRFHLPTWKPELPCSTKRENAVVNTFLVVKARRLCSARGAKVLPVSVLISKLLVLLCCRDLMLQKLLDFGEVKISYISFFDIKKHETVNSRWDLELGQEQMRLVKSRDLLLVITSHRLLSPIYVKRQASEVFLKDGKFFYKNSGDMLQTSSMKDSDPQKFWCSAHQKCYMFGRRGSFNS